MDEIKIAYYVDPNKIRYFFFTFYSDMLPIHFTIQKYFFLEFMLIIYLKHLVVNFVTSISGIYPISLTI